MFLKRKKKHKLKRIRETKTNKTTNKLHPNNTQNHIKTTQTQEQRNNKTHKQFRPKPTNI